MTRTLVRVCRSASGNPHIELATGLLAPRLVRRTGREVEIALVATTATLLGRDHAEVRIEVGAGLRVLVRDVAATVAYDGQGASARWDASLDVAADAHLTWQAEPLVVCDGADVRRSLRANVARDGTLLLRDTVALGRAGQRGGDLRCSTRLTYDDRPALAEDLDLTRMHRDDAGMLAGARLLDSITLLGRRPPAGAGHFDLAAPGAMARRLTDAAHTSDLDATWASWATGCP